MTAKGLKPSPTQDDLLEHLRQIPLNDSMPMDYRKAAFWAHTMLSADGGAFIGYPTMSMEEYGDLYIVHVEARVPSVSKQAKILGIDKATLWRRKKRLEEKRKERESP